MALHAGEAEQREGDYFGPPLNRVARLLAAGHGGQVLLTRVAADGIRSTLVDGVDLRDLGGHRLKDLTRPEHIFQALAPDLPADFPPLKTLDARPNNLPVQPTPLVGRESDVAAIRALLAEPGTRSVTLLGPGGIGKTRLSLQVAAEVLEAFPDGVWFVDLAPVREASLVASAVARAAGVREEGARPITETLQEALRDERVLLLLDNFEQVLGAASMVASLLAACPGLVVLVTSRARLGLRGERTYPVEPLALPDPRRLPPLAELAEVAAVRLFVERAQTAKASFALTPANAGAVAGICVRLDGLPLALELAAARTKLLQPAALLTRLEKRLTVLTGGARDHPERQQTLRDLIAWSHDLLAPEERTLFRRLAVFAGGCTFEAAEAVADPDGELNALDGLESLVDKSLLQQTEEADGQPRFGMLETIREYGLERLWEADEAEEVRARHAAHYLTLAEQAEPELTGPEQATWLERLEANHDNLRAALGWSDEAGETETGLRLAGALRRFWWVRGYLSEGRGSLERLLASPRDVTPAVRAKALDAAGALAWEQSNYGRATRLIEDALAIHRQLEDTDGKIRSLVQLGLVATDLGEYEQAESRYQEGLVLIHELGDMRGVSIQLLNLGMLAFLRGEFDRAVELYERSLDLSKGLGDQQLIASALVNLGECKEYQGNLGRATYLYHEALVHFQRLGDKPRRAFALAGLGRVALVNDNAARSREFLDEALLLHEETGDTRGVIACLEALAGVAIAEGDPIRAPRLYGAAEAIREIAGTPLADIYRVALARAVAAARATLSPEVWEAAWGAGRALPIASAIAEAKKQAVVDQPKFVSPTCKVNK
ncbi:MAG: tetratricopeptide repeat protein [Chloroflexota bacterium]|nr:tetratricopeptide repeat protein [Chloroflexota bacterium]